MRGRIRQPPIAGVPDGLPMTPLLPCPHEFRARTSTPCGVEQPCLCRRGMASRRAGGPAVDPRPVREHHPPPAIAAFAPSRIPVQGPANGSAGGRPMARDPGSYAGCDMVERCSAGLEQFRGLATRYADERLYRAILIIATLVPWLREDPLDRLSAHQRTGPRCSRKRNDAITTTTAVIAASSTSHRPPRRRTSAGRRREAATRAREPRPHHCRHAAVPRPPLPRHSRGCCMSSL